MRTRVREGDCILASSHVDKNTIYMGERFQGYSVIQDFEADFKVSLKMLKSADDDNFLLDNLTWIFFNILEANSKF